MQTASATFHLDLVRAERTENVGGSTAFVFVVAFGDLARTRRKGRSQIRMQGNGLFVKANYRFSGMVGFLMDRQYVFHLAQILGAVGLLGVDRGAAPTEYSRGSRAGPGGPARTRRQPHTD